MTLSSTKLISELQYYFEDFITNSIVNRSQIPSPVTVDISYIPQQSFIELLFNENYSYTTYKYLYSENITRSTIPLEFLDRLMLYSNSGKYMELNETGDNLFLLQNNDFIMLDALLSYRIDSTSLNIIDTTGMISFDTTSEILYINFDLLDTSLSKLIYLYLDLKIRGNVSKYNNITVITNGDLLSTCYEVYILDEFFKVFSGRGV